MNWYEFFFDQNRWSTAPGRSAGIFINPNISASALSTYLVVWLAARNQKFTAWDTLVLGLGVGGIFFTFSRSGIVIFLPLVVLVLWRRLRRFGGTGGAGRLAATFVALTVFLAVRIAQEVNISKDALTRISLFTSLEYQDDSYYARASRASEYWGDFINNFWTGAGPWTTLRLSVGPHNMFVSVALDYGIGGLLLYSTFLIAILRRVWLSRRTIFQTERGLAITVATLWIVGWSFFSHNVLSETPSLTVMALVVGWLYQEQGGKVKARYTPRLPAPSSEPYATLEHV